MAGVLSVERVTVTLGAGVTSNSASLTKGQTIANCVPFITKRVTTVASPVDDWSEQCVDVFFSGSTLVAQTSANTPRALVIEATVVEFDPVAVKVQSGTYQLTSAETSMGTPVSITAVSSLSVAFLVHASLNASTNAINDSAAIRGFFVSTSSLNFDRGASNGQVDGHWWVVEALTPYPFLVRTVFLNTGATSQATATISAVTMNKTFLVGSFNCLTTADDNALGSCYVDLQDTTTVRLRRAGTTGVVISTTYAVVFSGAETVQRGIRVQSTSIASDTVGITTVDTDLAMAWTPAWGSFKNAGLPGAASSDNADSQYGIDFQDLSTLRFQHSVSGGEASNNISWEVIEWEIVTATVDQEGYRWYDDGTESASVARQLQDTVDTISRGTIVQLRVLLDSTGDAPGIPFCLEYKESGDAATEWRKVLIP